MVMQPVIDQRTTIYTAYVLMLEDPGRYTLFRSRDVAKAAGVDVAHTAALIRKCFLAELISKEGMDGNAMRYKLTKKGLDRGEYYFEHWNPITNEMY